MIEFVRIFLLRRGSWLEVEIGYRTRKSHTFCHFCFIEVMEHEQIEKMKIHIFTGKIYVNPIPNPNARIIASDYLTADPRVSTAGAGLCRTATRWYQMELVPVLYTLETYCR